MTMSVAAKHAKGKFAQDKIFGANAAANARAAEIGNANVTNATIGAILDEEENLTDADKKAFSIWNLSSLNCDFNKHNKSSISISIADTH